MLNEVDKIVNFLENDYEDEIEEFYLLMLLRFSAFSVL